MPSGQERLDIIINARDQASTRLGNIKKAVVGIGAAYLTWQSAKSIISWTIDAAMKSEKSWAGVANAVRIVGEDVETQIPRIRKFAGELQSMSGISDEAIGEMIQIMMQYGMSTDEALSRATTTVDFAVARQMDLKAAADLVGKSYVGYTSTLSRYGIILDDSLSKEEKFSKAMEKMTEQTKGAAAAMGGTLSGRLNALKEAFGDLGEVIGLMASNPAVINTLNRLTGFFEFVVEKSPVLDEAFGVLGASMSALFTFLKNPFDVDAYTKALDKLKDKKVELALAVVEVEYGMAKTNTTMAAGTAVVESTIISDGEILAQMHERMDLYREEQELLQRRMQILQDNFAVPIPPMIIDDEEFTEEKMMIEKLQAAAMKASDKAYEQNKIDLTKAAQVAQEKMNLIGYFAEQAARRTVQAFRDGQATLRNIFSQIAQDFIDYALNAILSSAYGKLFNVGTSLLKNIPVIGSVVSLLGFDDPRNDNVAYQHGSDYAKYFKRGMNDNLQGPTFGEGVSTALRSNNDIAAAGSQTIIINVADVSVGIADRVFQKLMDKIDNNELPIVTRNNIRDIVAGEVHG